MRSKPHKKLYLLLFYNCQHFAVEMATGDPNSADANSAFSALLDGLKIGVDNCARFIDTQASNWLNTKPFNNDHFLGRVGNSIIFVLVTILVLCVILLLFTGSTVCGALTSYLTDVNQRGEATHTQHPPRITLPITFMEPSNQRLHRLNTV
jgi:hypothetical protein